MSVPEVSKSYNTNRVEQREEVKSSSVVELYLKSQNAGASTIVRPSILDLQEGKKSLRSITTNPEPKNSYTAVSSVPVSETMSRDVPVTSLQETSNSSSWMETCSLVSCYCCACLAETAGNVARQEYWYGQYEQDRASGNTAGAAYAAGQAGTPGGALGAIIAPGYTDQQMQSQHEADECLISYATTCCNESAEGCLDVLTGCGNIIGACCEVLGSFDCSDSD